MKVFFFSLVILFSYPTFSQEAAPDSFAVLKTSFGDIRIKLHADQAPMTVGHFIGLVRGTTDWKDVKTGKLQRDTPFYKDLIFHRIHPELGIQTGCPWGTGHGSPGVSTNLEKQTDVKFDRPFLVGLSFIPGRPTSGGTQFFITTKPSKDLDGKYPIFGEVVNGFDVVKQISRQRRDAMMKPLKDILLKEIVLE